MEGSKHKLKWEEAIKEKKGPMLIIAGPGTGKTYTLIRKIKHLVESNKNEKIGIIVSTFTRKATEEIILRLYSEIDNNLLINTNLLVGTIHSICHNLLMTYFGEKFSEHEVMPEEYQISFIRSKLINLGFSGDEIRGDKAWTLSEDLASLFNYITDQELIIDDINSEDEKLECLISKYELYTKLLSYNKLFDFASIQKQLLIELHHNLDILAKIQTEFCYHFIDEYQDVNNIQDKLIKLLSSKENNLTVVGDDDQSIYGFRGSEVKLIGTFFNEMKTKHGYCNVLELNKNYRSTSNIVSLTNEIVDNATYPRLNKIIKPNRSDTAVNPLIHCAENNECEAKFIADAIKKYLIASKGSYKDICILFRSVKSHSEQLKIGLFRNNIPFTVHVGGDFFDIEIGVELMSVLDYLLSKEDNPIQDLIDAFEEYDIKNNTDIASFYHDQEIIDLLFEKKKKLNKYNSCLGLFYDICSSLGWLSRYKDQGRDIGVLSELIQSFDMYADYFDPFSLFGYLAYLRRSKKVNVSYNDEDKVKLMTIHQAKGLEFPFVIIASQIERSTPPLSVLDKLKLIIKDKDLIYDEERRIFYVGCTRAENLLLITFTKNLVERKKKYLPNKYVKELLNCGKLSNDLDEFFDKYKGNKKVQKQAHKPVKISYNKIKIYQTCPLLFMYQNIWGLSTVRIGGMIFGSNVHKIIEVVLNRISQGKFNYESKDIINIFNNYWNSSQFRSKKEDEKYKKAAYNQISNFIHLYKDKLYPESIFYVEDSFNIMIDNILVNGRIDAVLKYNNNYEILEFKTGDKRDYSDQLSFYSYCFNFKYQVVPNKLLVYYLKAGVTEQIDFADYKKELSNIKAISNNIENKVFPAKPGKHCKDCAYNVICEYY